MNHKGTVRLETDRLVLRPFTVADAEAVYRNWASDREVTRYLTWPTHKNVEVTRRVLEDLTALYGRQDYYQWAITPKERQTEPIGSIAVISLDEAVNQAEVGYCLGRAWWGQGIVSESLGAVLDFLFMETGVNRVVARHDTRNPGSGRVMAKCAMTFEGIERQAGRNNQGICDTARYAILRQDYNTGNKTRKVRLTITESRCRSGYHQTGESFVVDDLCPPICHELWYNIYPMFYALKNGGELDCGERREKCFTARCPDGGRVVVHGEIWREG